jgi:hypothetical protein
MYELSDNTHGGTFECSSDKSLAYISLSPTYDDTKLPPIHQEHHAWQHQEPSCTLLSHNIPRLVEYVWWCPKSNLVYPGSPTTVYNDSIPHCI